ncbi:MobV family relaxase (plasmid) [Lactiplantibacillus pentosus]
MSYLVANMQKLKADNLVGLGNHDQRRTQHHKNTDIEVDRSGLNYDLVAGRTNHFKTDIAAYINEHKTSQRAVRKDAVLVNEWIISSDSNFFANLTVADTRKYFETAKAYFAEKFGEENVRYAIVHLDESTPHMHMGIVPFDDEYKLSAKRVFNRAALQNVQDQLPTYLQQHGFNIQRGVQESERKSLTVPEYKAMREDLKKATLQKQEIQAELEDARKRLAELKPRDQQEIESKPTFLSKDKVVVRKSDLHDLESRAAVSDIYNQQQNRLKLDNQSLNYQLLEVKDNNYELSKKNEKLQKLVDTLQGIVRSVDRFLQRKLGVGLPSEWLERAGLKEPSKNAPQRPQERSEGQHDELDGPSL